MITAKILEMLRTSFLSGDSSDAIDPNLLSIYIQSKTNLRKKIPEIAKAEHSKATEGSVLVFPSKIQITKWLLFNRNKQI